ncbi:alpha/beta hydrolase [Marinibactrum halimedae]|uniref:IroE protein n=1 Tax=Marinibactrum halimedae TaxID=1444977 RepID=A0AA37WKW4_9GAMM|nr:alpha/beta hydrolase-fold protein [Marinibactrum halimedae]MCD9458166.1 alpha/beta hydrolase [Marinibactrum halimedae]GLS25099.1 IroE protein [Marinibactrum halimedae]
MNRIFLTAVFFLFLQANTFASVTQVERSFEIKNSEIYTISSSNLGREYDIYVKVPHDYLAKESEKKTYPVLYLNDGPHTFKVASGVTHFPSMDKAIIVGIAFAHGENGQFSRVRDLTPEQDKSWKSYKTGGAAEYLTFIEKEVFPFIEEKFRADPDKRILAGHSLGGSFGTWVFLTKPEMFSSYILTSPSLWWKNNTITATEDFYAKNNKNLKINVFYATCSLETPENGMKEMVKGHQKFVSRLRSRNYAGLNLQDEIVQGTDHYSTFPVGLAKGLRWIYQELWSIKE